MRLPRRNNPRIVKQLLLRFGNYEIVYPAETTLARIVPAGIPRPPYAETGQRPTKPKTIEIKDHDQIEGMRQSCKLAATILKKAGEFIKVGVTTDAIDELVHGLTVQAGAYPSPLNYAGFPKSVCTSVNNVAAHGIPDLRPLQDGDIVNVDITVFYKGYHGDCSQTFAVGAVDDRGRHLLDVTDQCLDIGVKVCGPGVPFKEIGAAIERHAKVNRLAVIPGLAGHGIGTHFHGPPDIYHVRNRVPGIMKAGMTFTIEPALTHGGQFLVVLPDGWTVVTEDGARSAQAEHTVLVTDDGAEVLTK